MVSIRADLPCGALPNTNLILPYFYMALSMRIDQLSIVDLFVKSLLHLGEPYPSDLISYDKMLKLCTEAKNLDSYES